MPLQRSPALTLGQNRGNLLTQPSAQNLPHLISWDVFDSKEMNRSATFFNKNGLKRRYVKVFFRHQRYGDFFNSHSP